MRPLESRNVEEAFEVRVEPRDVPEAPRSVLELAFPFVRDEPMVRPLASRNVRSLPRMIADPLTLPLASRKVIRSPDRVAEPLVRPLASRKSARSEPLRAAASHFDSGTFPCLFD